MVARDRVHAGADAIDFRITIEGRPSVDADVREGNDRERRSWLSRIPGTGNVANRANFIDPKGGRAPQKAAPDAPSPIQDDGKDKASMWLPSTKPPAPAPAPVQDDGKDKASMWLPTR
eukprot:CAMPEP_0119522650 /NCGR_PEP_ID=MMETSP1344-20130328/37911_1 /TAXON_ID=236787 /ORGANISM="Florenciella parvula, Strain CCMP2471" /LENGTH=117 /DNA_ID=CAMNT_0007560699 /DNA_START=804 /DNA_END=1155 /DNA_ORIENTATION=+